MRRYITTCLLAMLLLGVSLPQKAKAQDPISQAIINGVKKVIRAMDIAVQRIQNETIRLQNVQKQIENAMNKLKLKEIYDWSKKQTDLFSKYYDELWKVKNAITYYQRIKDIIATQVQVVTEYKRAIQSVSKIKTFKPNEVAFILEVYSGILEQSISNIDELQIVVNSFKTQMSDAERLALIHQSFSKIQRNLGDLRSFTNHNLMLGYQRMKDEAENKTLKGLYNLP